MKAHGMNARGVTVIETELAAVTADGSDCPQLGTLVPVLHQLRKALGMELVFVGATCSGEIAVHPATHHTDSASCFAETAYGRMLLQARCGTAGYAAVPVRADDGMLTGTLLCSLPPGDPQDRAPKSLQTASRLLAGRIQAIAQQGAAAG